MENLTKAILANGEILNKAYDDAIHPAAENIGKAAGTLTSTLDLLLAPISWAVYGFDIIDQKVKYALNKKFNDTPLDKIKEPDANIVIPAYEALRYSLDNDYLKEMYVNLIASSMLKEKKELAHPSFVEIIKQLSSFDAEFLKLLFSDGTIQIPKIKLRFQVSETNTTGIDVFPTILSPKYYRDHNLLNDYLFSLENFERLKIIQIADDYALSSNGIYEEIINSINIQSFSSVREDLNYVNLVKGSVTLTKFGNQFTSIVL